MTTVIAVIAFGLSAVLAAGCGVLWLRARILDRRATELRAALDRLAPAGALPVANPTGRRIITVEILNPLAVATRESRAGGVLGTVAPALVTRIVYDQACRQIQEGLTEEGVEAEVRIHVG
ncbi:MAG: hypothetical protein ACSLEW_10780 [Nocardioides sp.]